MQKKIKPQSIIRHYENRQSINELVQGLRDYDCPQEILDKLAEWMLQMFMDRVKLERWKNEEGIDGGKFE